MFHTNLCHAPALFIVSKTDPVGAEQSNIRVRDSWISNGVDITWKCFDKSPHVMASLFQSQFCTTLYVYKLYFSIL